MQEKTIQRKDTSRDYFYAARILAPSLLLVLVASLQVYRSHAHHLSAWKGGGFGMFSTVDHPSVRYLRCYLLTEKGELPVPVPGRRARLELKARTLPLPQNLAQLADTLLSDAGWIEDQLHEQSVVQQDASKPGPDQPPQGGTHTDPSTVQPILLQHVQGMRVEVWTTRFDAQTERLVCRKLAQAALHSRNWN